MITFTITELCVLLVLFGGWTLCAMFAGAWIMHRKQRNVSPLPPRIEQFVRGEKQRGKVTHRGGGERDGENRIAAGSTVPGVRKPAKDD